MAQVLRDTFHDDYAEYGNILRRVNLFFKRRAYLIATINF